MSKQVTIPSNMNPWWCNINGVVYSYTAGSTQTVPDEVAAIIENYNNMLPKLDEPLKNKLYGTGSNGEPCFYDKGSFESNEELFYITADSETLTYTINGVSKDDAGWNAMYEKMCNAYDEWFSNSHWNDTENTANKKRCRILIYEPLAWGDWLGDTNSIAQFPRAHNTELGKLTVHFTYTMETTSNDWVANLHTYVLKGTGEYSNFRT